MYNSTIHWHCVLYFVYCVCGVRCAVYGVCCVLLCLPGWLIYSLSRTRTHTHTRSVRSPPIELWRRTLPLCAPTEFRIQNKKILNTKYLSDDSTCAWRHLGARKGQGQRQRQKEFPLRGHCDSRTPTSSNRERNSQAIWSLFVGNFWFVIINQI